jgi:hypothetical protein
MRDATAPEEVSNWGTLEYFNLVYRTSLRKKYITKLETLVFINDKEKNKDNSKS